MRPCVLRFWASIVVPIVVFTRAASGQGAPPFAPDVRRETEVGGTGASPRPPGQRVPPRLLHFVEAAYSEDAQRAGIQGNVVLQLDVDASGHVTDATVTQGLGHGLDEAAVAAARQFVFEPARLDGAAVPARIRYRYHFALREVAPAQQGPAAVLRGFVRDATNRAVRGATVEIIRPGATALRQSTDASGAFRFELDAPGVYGTSVIADGYRAYRAEEQLARGDDLQVIYRVVPLPSAAATASSAAPGEQEITVRGARPAREVTRTTLDRREIMRIPGTGGDALRAIQNLPGLSRASFLSGALIVRGASPADTGVYVDGTELPLLYHFGGLSSVIQTDMLDRIDFYPGNYSARFGREMAGIVDVGLRSPRRQGYHAVANVNLIDASFFAEGAITSTLSLAIAARRSYIDAVLGAVLSGTHSPFIAAPVYYDYQAVLEWHPSVHHRVRLAILGDSDTLAVLFHDPNDSAPTLAGQFNLDTEFHVAQLSWVFDPAPGTRSTAMVSVGWLGANIDGGESLSFRLTNYPIDARYELSHTVMAGLRLNMGVDIQAGPATVSAEGVRLAGSPDLLNSQRVASNVNIFIFRPGTYLEAELTPIAHLRIVPSIRLDWFQEIHAGLIQPRMSFRYELPYNFVVRGGVGLYAGPPSFIASTNAPNAFFPGQMLGNPDLRPQRAMHYALALEHTFAGIPGLPQLANVTLSTEAFYKVLDDLVVATPTIQLLQQNPPPPYGNTGTGHVMGLEVLLRYRADAHFFGWIAYTLMRSTRSNEPGEPEHLYIYDQTHILTILGSYNFGHGFEVGLRFRYVTGNLYTPVVGSYFNANSLTYAAIDGPTNSQRMPDFQQLDLRVDKSFRIDGGTFGIYLEILNLYNYTNVEGYQYNYNYTQRAPVTGLPIFPNLGIRGEI